VIASRASIGSLVTFETASGSGALSTSRSVHLSIASPLASVCFCDRKTNCFSCEWIACYANATTKTGSKTRRNWMRPGVVFHCMICLGAVLVSCYVWVVPYTASTIEKETTFYCSHQHWLLDATPPCRLPGRPVGNKRVGVRVRGSVRAWAHSAARSCSIPVRNERGVLHRGLFARGVCGCGCVSPVGVS